ncbi:MAG: hypothetical protein ACRYHQ_24260 [Janthinobacterium lividum]
MKRRIAGLGFDLTQACSLTAEVVSVAPSLVWSVLLLMPGCTFCTGSNYALLVGIPERLAAWIFVAHLSLFFCGWRQRSHRVRRYAAHWGCIQWLGVTGALVAAQPHNTAWVYLVFSMTALLASVQLGFARYRSMAAKNFARTMSAASAVASGGRANGR